MSTLTRPSSTLLPPSPGSEGELNVDFNTQPTYFNITTPNNNLVCEEVFSKDNIQQIRGSKNLEELLSQKPEFFPPLIKEALAHRNSSVLPYLEKLCLQPDIESSPLLNSLGWRYKYQNENCVDRLNILSLALYPRTMNSVQFQLYKKITYWALEKGIHPLESIEGTHTTVLGNLLGNGNSFNPDMDYEVFKFLISLHSDSLRDLGSHTKSPQDLSSIEPWRALSLLLRGEASVARTYIEAEDENLTRKALYMLERMDNQLIKDNWLACQKFNQMYPKECERGYRLLAPLVEKYLLENQIATAPRAAASLSDKLHFKI